MSIRLEVSLICGLLLCSAVAMAAIDEARLWLPSSHAKLFIDLKKAAEAAASLEDCQDVLRGTIDLEQSRPTHPIYRILCRRQSGTTYNEMVDGLSFDTLTTKIIIPPTPTPEELEAERLAALQREAEARENRIRDLWNLCFEQLSDKTALMQNVQWQSPLPPDLKQFEDADKAVFLVDFNATNDRSIELRFRAKCRAGEDGKPHLLIKRRSESEHESGQ